MYYHELKALTSECDAVFNVFYDTLLSRKTFAKYFTSTGLIEDLLNKQKVNYLDSLDEDQDTIFKRYYRIGVIHYDHDIPYEVFLNGCRILKDAFAEVISRKHSKPSLILLCNDYFDFISEAMAKGYLDKFIHNDKSDAEKMLSLISTSTFGAEKELLTLHYSWLIMLLDAIEMEDMEAVTFLKKQHETDEGTIYGYIKSHLIDLGKTFSDDEIDRIRNRILINVESIFFYLEKKAYSDALALVINILEIYKLTLILDNVITNIIVKKAETVIDEKVKLSETDPLTNTMNRRKFEDVLEGLVMRAQKTYQPLSLSMIDIDNFKSINDRFGHSKGDAALVQVSKIIKSLVRQNDLTVRYGGEEFVIISSETDLLGAAKMGEKIRETIQKHVMNEIGNITLSIGVAELSKEDNHQTFIDRADKMLYQAKNSGKNKVCY